MFCRSWFCVRNSNIRTQRDLYIFTDLHIARDGVLRIRLGAHQEHQVNHVARATDSTKVWVIEQHHKKRILRLNRTCRRVMPVTLTEVKVQVFFFSCIAGRVRDIVGQQRDENENEIKIP